MSGKRTRSKQSPEPSAVSLEELLQSEKSTTQTTMMSLTRRTRTPGKERSGANGSLTRKNKAALDNFEAAVGSRADLVDLLTLSNLSEKEKHFVNLLCDPARERDKVATIARDAGLLPSQIIDLFRSASFATSPVPTATSSEYDCTSCWPNAGSRAVGGARS